MTASSSRGGTGVGRTASFVAIGLLLLLVLLGAGFVVYRYRQPVPPVTIVQGDLPKAAPGPALVLPWPQRGTASVWVEQVGIVGTTPEDKPRTLASVTKIMTALVVLEAHPLAQGERGPDIAVTATDVRNYEAAIADDQSAVPVQAGTSLTQYQMLQALLLPSGNNIADMLAVWDTGAIPAFVAKMNARAAQLGMKDTRYADTSGNNPASVGSSRDQALLASVAMQHPIFAQIVAMPQATIPTAGVIHNVNRLVGTDGNIGVKTGSGFEAGAGFAFAVQGQSPAGPVRIVGASLGHDQLEPAFQASRTLAAAALQGVRNAEVIAGGQTVGHLEVPWGEHIPLVTGGGATFRVWPGIAIESRLEATTPTVGANTGAEAGTLVLRLGDQEQRIPLRTGAPLLEPTSMWRIFR